MKQSSILGWRRHFCRNLQDAERLFNTPDQRGSCGGIIRATCQVDSLRLATEEEIRAFGENMMDLLYDLNDE
jgi:hypothetical protein